MAQKYPSQVWKIQDLLDTLHAEVTAREAIHVSQMSSQKTNHSLRPLYHRARSLYASSQPPTYAYCGDNHYPSQCTTILGVKERREFLLKRGRSFNCLKPQHRVKDCESTMKCKHCRKKHHQLICDKVNSKRLQLPP